MTWGTHRRRRAGAQGWLGVGAFASLTAALTAAATGCDDDEPASTELQGTLAMEIRDSAAIVIAPRANGVDTIVRVTLSKGYGLAPAGVGLEGPGRIEALPEAGSTLYTARLSAAANPDGPCGSEPVSLALSLHRQADNAMVVGGLTAYCGSHQWHGNPPRVLRLSGELPL